MRKAIVIGTRKSALALWQSNYVRDRFQQEYPALRIELKHIVTRGDKTQEAGLPLPEIGGKGLFTAELEHSLLTGEIDLAVHSLKDLPTILAPEFVLGAIPERAAVEDVLISRSGQTLRDLPKGAVVGTSSVRRSSQLLRLRPDLKAEHIRGNIETRIRKARALEGPYDAIVIARAGLVRLGIESEITEVLTTQDILPAPGQGALGIECRADDNELLGMLGALHHLATAHAVTAERSFLAALEAGCNTPVAAYAQVVQVPQGDARVVFQGRCVATDGSKTIEVQGESVASSAAELGAMMAAEAKAKGFERL